MAQGGIKKQMLFLLLVGQVDMNIRVVFRHGSSFSSGCVSCGKCIATEVIAIFVLFR